MEDVKAYIESGILELYVLGEVSAEERAQVEAMAQEHPVVKAELLEIERSMEYFAAEHQIEPSEGLRDRVLNSLLTNLADDHTFPSRKPLHATEPAKMVSLPVPAKNNNFYKYAFAACLALLLASVAALINIYSKLQLSNDKVLALSTQNQQYSKTVNFQNDQLLMFRDTAYKMIKLKDVKGQTSSMNVAWSPTAKKVMIDMAGMKLPVNDKTHQYQLWAIVAGKPVDLGVFDMNPDGTAAIKVMKPVGQPTTFAVTLEPHGGSVNPTLTQMVVAGNI